MPETQQVIHSAFWFNAMREHNRPLWCLNTTGHGSWTNRSLWCLHTTGGHCDAWTPQVTAVPKHCRSWFLNTTVSIIQSTTSNKTSDQQLIYIIKLYSGHELNKTITNKQKTHMWAWRGCFFGVCVCECMPVCVFGGGGGVITLHIYTNTH